MNATDAMIDSISTTDDAVTPAATHGSAGPDHAAPVDGPASGSVPPPPPAPPEPPSDDVPPQPLPPPSPFQPPVRQPWWKRPVARMPNGKDGGKVGGVVSGLARAYGFDVRTSRIAVLVAPFVLPIIPMLYIALWILLPKSPEEAKPLDSLIRDRQRMPLLVIIGIVLVASGVGSFGPWFAFGGFPWGLALIGIGVLLWVSPELIGSSGRTTTTPAAGPPAPPSPYAAPGQPAFTTMANAPTAASAASARRRRRPIGWLSLGVSALFVAAAEGLDAVDAWNPAVLTVAITAIAIVIGGLFVSAAVNRSLLGAAPILVLSAALTFLAVARPQLDGGFGERNVAVTGATSAARTERLGAGRLKIDLSAESAPSFALDATLGLGQLQVIVPARATVHLHSNVRMGEVEVDGHTVLDGIHVTDDRAVTPVTNTVITPTTATAPTIPAAATSTPLVIDLDLQVGAGQISIVHAG